MTPAAALRVLYLSHTMAMAGGEFQVLQMSRALLARGCRVMVACHAQNASFRHALQNAGIPVYPISPAPFFGNILAKPRIVIGFLLSLCQIVKEFRPDIIGPTTLVSAIAATLLKPLLVGRLIYALMVVKDNRRPSFLLRFVFSRLDGVMYNSAYTRDSYRTLIDTEVPQFLNYSLVDDPRKRLPPRDERTALRQRLLGGYHYLIGYVGRISPEKGAMDFLLMAELLCQRGQNIRFVVIGDEDRRHPRYCRKVAKYAKTVLGDVLEFTGHIPDIASYLSVLDVLVLPTHGEGFGRVALEAAYLGVPVVGTTPGGLDEVLRHYPRSKLVGWGRPDLLVDAVEEFLRDEHCGSLYEYYDHPSYLQTLSEIFSCDALAEKEINFYWSVVNNTPPILESDLKQSF